MNAQANLNNRHNRGLFLLDPFDVIQPNPGMLSQQRDKLHRDLREIEEDIEVEVITHRALCEIEKMDARSSKVGMFDRQQTLQQMRSCRGRILAKRQAALSIMLELGYSVACICEGIERLNEIETK